MLGISWTWWIFLLRISFCWFEPEKRSQLKILLRPESNRDDFQETSFLCLPKFSEQQIFILTSSFDENGDDEEKQMWLRKLVTFLHLLLFPSRLSCCTYNHCQMCIKNFLHHHMSVRRSEKFTKSVENKKKSKLKVYNEFLVKSWGSCWLNSDRKYQLTARLHLNDAGFACDALAKPPHIQQWANKKQCKKIELHTFLIFLI